MTLNDAKTAAELIQAVVTSIGVVLAGIWTYLLFVQRRQRFPRAKLTHRTQQVRLPDGRRLLRVAATIQNTGEVLVCLNHIRIRVQHVYPIPPHIAESMLTSSDPGNGACEFPWPVLGAREWKIDRGMGEVEPGESEEFHGDFLLPKDVESVLLYTHTLNISKGDRNIGWSDTQLLSFTEGVKDATTAAPSHTP